MMKFLNSALSTKNHLLNLRNPIDITFAANTLLIHMKKMHLNLIYGML